MTGLRSAMKLGDLDVARIGLGSNRLTRRSEHIALMRSAIDAGVQMIDTAYSYTGGESEQTIGDALAPFPEHIVVATKGGGGPSPGRGRPEVLRRQIEESLDRLQTATIPLYYLHRVDPATPLQESLEAINEFVVRGKIRYVGISEVAIDDIERARKVVPIAAVQNHYNIAERKWDSVVDYCAREGIVFVPFYPLRAEGRGLVAEIARRRSISPQQVMLAWLLRRSPAMLPIPGTLSPKHLFENVAAAAIELTDREFRDLGREHAASNQ